MLILVAAAALRLYHLDLKPLHHDEGVNAYFFERLFLRGIYHYDPANYHGPTLYYCALVISSVIEIFSRPNDLTAVAIRLVPALFGIATVALLLCLRKQVGDIGALAAAGLVAVSPGAVYFSRDFIHEALLVFFTLVVTVAMLRYRDTLKPSYLMLASAAAALMFATKETAAVSGIVLLLALLITFCCARSRVWVAANGEGSTADSSKALPRGESLGRVALVWVLAAVVFVAVCALFYSSFFSDRGGIYHAVDSFRYWVKTGSQLHREPWYTYLRWMEQAELPILTLGIAGTVLTLWRRRDLFVFFAVFWSWGLIAAYSLLPYKTPWLILNYIVPLAIVSGCAVQAAWDWVQQRGSDRLAQVMLVLMTLILGVSLSQSVALNFFRYDDARLPYVYMQTYRTLIPMIEEIGAIAAQSGAGRQTSIMVTSRDYWPLPWYLRDYSYVGYPGRIVQLNAQIIIASEIQERELVPLLGNNYRRIRSYPLRPGVTFVLYARNR